MIIMEYRHPTRIDRWRKARWVKRQVDGLLGRDYTIITAVLAIVIMAAFALMFCGWWTAGRW